MKKSIKIFIGISTGVIILITAALLLLLLSGPKKKDYADLVNPRIVKKENVKSIKVYFDGDPKIVIKEAFEKLFKTYYSLKDVPKFKLTSSPIARYRYFDEIITTHDMEKLNKMGWKGYVAIPVPDNIIELPDDAKLSPYPAVLETLEYGMVAEIVHFGRYQDEMPAIEKLRDYVSEQGYEMSGHHEEEYIKGPGTPFANPKKFITIIRYQVRKK